MNKFLSVVFVSALMFGCADHTHKSVTVSDGNITPGTILVDAKDDISDSDLADLSAIAGTTLYAHNDTARKYKYEVGKVDPANEDIILARLNSDPRVESAEPMVEYHALYTPNDPLYTESQWHMTRVGAESSWNMACGMGVKVAVIDTGVACFDSKGFSRISDLVGTKCEGGYNFVSDNDLAADDQMHGSHVAGTIAQATNNGIGGAGLAYCVTIMPVKVLAGNGSGTNEGVAEGIRYAADEGAQVINMSLGGSHPSKVIESAVAYAYKKGVVIVAAAGNSGGPVGYPAAYPGVIAVSATDEDDDMASFSSHGPEVAIGAPGTNVMQQTICNGGKDKCEGFEALNGTSMATPHVAAAAALLVGQGITDPDAVREKLQSTANHKEDKLQFGAGILRADRAVQSTVMWHFIWRLAALMALLFLANRAAKSNVLKSKMVIIGVILGGFGLMPLMFTGLLPHMGSFRWIGELAVRPIGEWDIVLGFNHNYLLLANFLPAALATVLMFGNKHLRMFAGGLALGSAALCAQIAFSSEVNFFMGMWLMKVWMGVSIAASMWIAKAVFTAPAK
jgi:serine protease